MISEQIIENSILKIDELSFDNAFSAFREEHPMLVAYLAGDQFSVLDDEEYKLMLFEAMVIAGCFEGAQYESDEQTAELLENCESDNWAVFNDEKSGTFSEKLDVFFDNSEEEELLAFIEDSLMEDEDDQINPAAKEIIFITLKSIVDFFHIIGKK